MKVICTYVVTWSTDPNDGSRHSGHVDVYGDVHNHAQSSSVDVSYESLCVPNQLVRQLRDNDVGGEGLCI